MPAPAGMRATVSNAREQMRSTLWFIPSLFVLAAFLLSWMLLALDEARPELSTAAPWLFRGTAESARALLQTIATAVITVVAAVRARARALLTGATAPQPASVAA